MTEYTIVIEDAGTNFCRVVIDLMESSRQVKTVDEVVDEYA